MSEIEKVAEAIGQRLIAMTPDDGSGVIFTGDEIRELACAAIEALREPTAEMLEAGMVAITHPAETIHSLDQQAASIFTAMINQILSTSPQAGREG